MWRYLLGLPRARIQWNGTWRSTPPTAYRDDKNDLHPVQNVLICESITFRRSEKDDGYSRWKGSSADYHKRFHCKYHFADALIIGSSFLLTCNVSQLWKCYNEQERKRKCARFEILSREARRLFSPACYVFGSGSPSKLEKDVSWPKSPPVKNEENDSEEDKDSEHQSASAGGKKVRFDVGFTQVTQPSVHEEQPLKLAHIENPLHYYAEFEESWKDLCERYDKMKCNRKGVQAAEAGHHAQAKSYFETAGSAGCAKAFFNLGLMYESGIGSSRDLQQAVHLYEQAALLGNSQAAHNLALIYLDRGLTGDQALAVDLLEKASSLGSAESKTELGVLYTGQGKMTEAYQLFGEAADQEDVDAMYFLGVCYENGFGVAKNECKAAELYRKASTAGNTEAQCTLAYFFENGLGGLPVNIESAIELYKQSSEAGNTQAKEHLSRLEQAWEQTDEGDDDLFTTMHNIRVSCSTPAISSYLHRHLLQLNHSDWELNIPSLHKSSTHSGALEGEESGKLNAKNHDIRVEVKKDKKDVVLFTLGDECESDDESVNSWSSDVTPDSMILDGGFGEFANLSSISAKRPDKQKSAPASNPFILDGGFGNLQNLSKTGTKSELTKKVSTTSLASFGSDSNFSIAFDENCLEAGLFSVSERPSKGEIRKL